MAKVVHTIKGHQYLYEHTRVGKTVVCKYLGKVGGGGRASPPTSQSTRVSSSPYNSYDSQADLDTQVRKAYRQGYGVKKIQRIFEEIDLHPTHRDVENYLTHDLGLELRKRAPKPKPTSDAPDHEAELEQAKRIIAVRDIERDSTVVQIQQMKTEAMKDASRIAALEAKLRDYRDLGRGPTVEEFEGMIDKNKI